MQKGLALLAIEFPAVLAIQDHRHDIRRAVVRQGILDAQEVIDEILGRLVRVAVLVNEANQVAQAMVAEEEMRPFVGPETKLFRTVQALAAQT